MRSPISALIVPTDYRSVSERVADLRVTCSGLLFFPILITKSPTLCLAGPLSSLEPTPSALQEAKKPSLPAQVEFGHLYLNVLLS